MPVIVNSENKHPFLPSLDSVAAIDKKRAETQDIRPLEIAIINLMADKQTTERQLALWLGHTPLQVKLTFAATDSYVLDVRNGRETTHTPTEHIRKFYSAWSDIKGNKYDGLIVTGVNALKSRVENEDIWPEVKKIFEWSKTNVFSSLFLCWGAKAALKHFYEIDSYKRNEKLWGVFPHFSESDQTGLLFGFPDVFHIPVSRWKEPRRIDIENCAALEIVADSKEAGPNIIVESGLNSSGVLFPYHLFVLGHPEYDTDTLRQEYERDHQNNTARRVPAHYFPEDDAGKKALNNWRSCAHVYTNWVHAVYEATPYDLVHTPLLRRAIKEDQCLCG
jgi:homoserine O-succinyltransferase